MDDIEQMEPLDRQLREAAPYIDDDGFTSRVLAQMPAPRRARFSIRALILLGVSLLSSALAYRLSDGGHFLAVSIEKAMTVPMMWLLAFALVAGLLVTTGGIFAALFTTRRVDLN